MQNKFAVWVVNAVVLSILLVGNLVLVNLIGQRIPVQADLTQRNAYTVSDVTKEKLEKVTGELVLTYYVSRETLPDTREFRALEGEILDRIESFEEHVEGRFRVEVKDPLEGSRDLDADKRKKWNAEGILPVEIEIDVEGKKKKHEFYSSLKMMYRGRAEVINRITDARNLEYKFLGALDQLMKAALPKVGIAFVLSEQEREWKTTVEKDVFGMLGSRASVQRVDLEKGPSGMKDLDVLFVLVRDRIPPAQLYEIDQFVMQGGRLVLCTDVFSLGRQMGGGGARFGMEPRWEVFDTGLEDWAGQMGVRLERRLVFDLKGCQKIPTMIPYPDGHEEPGFLYLSFDNTAQREGFNPRFPLGEDAERAVFRFPHAVAAAHEMPEGLEYDYLLRSSERSWQEDVTAKSSLGYTEITSLFMIGPNAEARLSRWQKEEALRQGHEEEAIRQGKAGSFHSTIGAVVRGRFTSYYESRKPPEGVAADNYTPPEGAALADASGGRKTILGSPEGRIVFIGDTDWIESMTQFEANRILLLALTNWLGAQEEYDELLGKGQPALPLYDEGDPEVREAFQEKQPLYTFLMVGLSPILVLAFGAWKLFSRYQEKVEQEAETQRGYARQVEATVAAVPGRKEEAR